jgi:hypothetical protein
VRSNAAPATARTVSGMSTTSPADNSARSPLSSALGLLLLTVRRPLLPVNTIASAARDDATDVSACCTASASALTLLTTNFALADAARLFDTTMTRIASAVIASRDVASVLLSDTSPPVTASGGTCSVSVVVSSDGTCARVHNGLNDTCQQHSQCEVTAAVVTRAGSPRCATSTIR